VDDILLRFIDLSHAVRNEDGTYTENPESRKAVADQHESVFYPAWFALPQASPIVFDLMRRIEGVRLGRVIITRLAPGKFIAPHEDSGDHAEYFDRYHCILQNHPGSIFRTGNEQVENFCDIENEVKHLLPLHWEELALNKDKVPLDPQYEIYHEKEASGQLFITTVRFNSKIIGYFCAFIGRALHYRSMLTCLPDIYFLHPEFRLQGTGKQLFTFVKEELKRRGVMYWVIGDKDHKALAAFFEDFGFSKIENYYSMWIGD
jgi:GNAT superfamily N-acetyltransferase